MSDKNREPSEEEIDDMTGSSPVVDRVIKHVPPHLLKPHPINEKIYGKEPVDQGLLESIKEGGIIEEIQVTPEYVIISGHRRWAVAIKLELETVPICVRYDITSGDAVVWALIEANRTQRSKTTEQKVREIMEVNERIKAFRKEVAYRYGAKTLKDVADAKIDPSKITSENASEMQSYIAENLDPKNDKSLSIPLKHYGLSEQFYKKARKAMIAIDGFVDKGKINEANEIRKNLNSKGMKAFDKVVDRLQGTVVKKNFTSPSVLMNKSIEAFTEAITHLPESGEHSKRASIALVMMRGIKDELTRMSKQRELSPATERIKHEGSDDSGSSAE